RELSQQLSRLQKSGSQLQKFFKRGFSLAPLISPLNPPTLFPLKLSKAPAAKPEQSKRQPAIPAVPIRFKSGKEWIPEVVKPVRDKLLALGTTKASTWVASQTPPDGKPVKPRSAEKILRDDLGFPKAFRGSKQRPK